jgi:nicotinamide phosphoribosyltransferase
MTINPLICTDQYKQGHYRMSPPGTTKVYSNLTPRKSRLEGVNHAVVFGVQYWLKEYVLKQWNDQFFSQPWEKVEARYKRIIDASLGQGAVTFEHIKQLHDLGYMPLKIKALPEGSLCPIRVPLLTITNTVDHAYWLPNFLETILSCTLWQPITSATIAREYLKLFREAALETTGDASFAQWQPHDFSMRGLSSLESACLSSAAHHAVGITGSDTIPAIEFLETYYGASVDRELIGGSVPATEHSIMALGGMEDEIGTFNRLLDTFPKGILSVVSDTWSLPRVLTHILPTLKDRLLTRDGKLVIRPDSFWTDPVDCLCGFDGYHPQMEKLNAAERETIRKGVVETLWDIFGGTVNSLGYKVLHPCISTIYGDSILIGRVKSINQRLKAKGFASTNWLAGCGSFGYQYNTRDSLGLAVKATYGVVNGEGREIWKDPVTDDGMKRSAKGLLQVINTPKGYVLKDCATPAEEEASELRTVFLDGKLVRETTLAEIRARVGANLANTPVV